jgi:uncharacterized protein YfaS (alpha-2-macroglobulin family)
MFSNLRKINFVLIALLLLNVSARAGGISTFEGIVRDPKGKPVKGAEVRVEDKKEIIIARGKTDASGHYVTNAVPAGAYKVDLVINSVINSSLPSVKTKSEGATQLNFAVKAEPKKSMPPSVHRTGSNLW